MNANQFANGSAIFTQNGYFARDSPGEPMRAWCA
jgi:hypothetical protein